jgi:flagellar FliJ protein
VKKFKFRFQAVEDVKKREEDLKRERLAEAQKTLQAQEAMLADLRRLRETCQRRMTERTVAGRLNAAEMVLSHLYLQKVTEDIQRQEAHVARVQQDVEARRKVLMEAAQDRKMVENLKARDQAAHAYEAARREQSTMDEIAGRSKPSSARDGGPPAGSRTP